MLPHRSFDDGAITSLFPTAPLLLLHHLRVLVYRTGVVFYPGLGPLLLPWQSVQADVGD